MPQHSDRYVWQKNFQLEECSVYLFVVSLITEKDDFKMNLDADPLPGYSEHAGTELICMYMDMYMYGLIVL